MQDENINTLIEEAQRRATETDLEAKLMAGLDSGEPTPLTANDWSRIRQTALARQAAP